jgi:hypothetical protein
MKYLNPINWFYFIKGWSKSILYKLLNQKKDIIYVANRASKCTDCWNNGECLKCGCSTLELFLSKKPCKND